MVAESSLLGTLLAASDAYQWEHHFAGTAVAADVLAHVRAFRAWWKTVRHDFPVAIDSLFGARPRTWHAIDSTSLVHFARVKLPRRGDEWLQEIEAWLRDESAWTTGNFLVAPRAVAPTGVRADAAPGLLVDIYARGGQPVAPEFLRASASRLAVHCKQSWSQAVTADSRELWRSIAVFGLRTFALMTRDSVRPLLNPAAIAPGADGDTGHVGYALMATPGDGLGYARTLAARFSDEIRRREFEAMLVVAEETASRHVGAPLLILLGATYLVDATKAQARRAEFDGVWAFFAEDQVHWYLLEHKKSVNPSGDLDAKLKFLTVPHSRYQARGECKGRVAVVSAAYGTS